MENNRTILIESDSERRTQLVHLLHASGFTVSVAADLATALLDSVRGPRGADPGARPTLAEIERRYAAEVLRATGGNKTRAAEILGIDRKTLYRLIGAARAVEQTRCEASEQPGPARLASRASIGWRRRATTRRRPRRRRPRARRRRRPSR